MFDIRKIQEQAVYNAVKSYSDEKTAAEIVYGEDSKAEDNPAWVKATMNRLVKRFDKDAVKQIRMNCQCGYAMDEKLALVKELMDGATPGEFTDQEKARAAGLYFEDGALYLQFLFCPCPMLAGVDRLETEAWCQCSAGYSKVLFEKAFGCEVDVELLKSLKMGHEKCLMRIVPREPVWKEDS